MAKSVNKVILVGNVGHDPEVKYTASGFPVAKVSLATNERFKDRNDQWQDRTEWHSVVAWQRLAEIVDEYVRKGSKLYIEGRFETSSWEDRQSGEKKCRTEIVARGIVLLSSRDNGSEGKGELSGEQSKPEPAPAIVDDDIPSSTSTDLWKPLHLGRATDRDGRTPPPIHPHSPRLSARPGAFLHHCLSEFPPIRSSYSEEVGNERDSVPVIR